ncbi:MAG: amidase [Pelagibacterales bacterium]|nr:amidase [Pelagibacterales bacterium]
MMDLCLLSALEIIEKTKKGEISSVEVAKSFIDRIEKFENKIKAWAFFDKKFFLEKAQEKDEWRLSGKPLGPLHGLPIAIKDIFKTEDMPTQYGTPIRENYQSRDDAKVVSILRSAGAIIMGKTVTTELAYFDPGKTTNPHDYSRTPGGSSSGSAAAVASFMAPIAIGSQTNGSTIRPASYCGVVGYKPTYGLVSRDGALAQSFLLDQVGVIARNVEDVALCSSVIIKKDLEDKSTISYPTEDFLTRVQAKPFFEPQLIFIATSKWKNLDDDAKKDFEKFLKKIDKQVTIYSNPSYFEKIFDYHKIIHETDMAYNFLSTYEKHKKKIGKKMIEAIERGLSYKAKDYAEAVDQMAIIYDTFKEAFHHYHAIITPATTGYAPKGLSYTGSPEFCTTWTYLGMPAITLPLIEGSAKLPLGVQLVGEKLDDTRLLQTANWLLKKIKKND